MDWNRRAALSVLALGAGIAFAVGMANRPDRSVSWSKRLTVIGCDAAAPARGCFVWLNVSVGNTGNVDLATVRVRLTGVRQEWRIDTRTADIRATLVPRAEPVLARLDSAEGVEFEVRPLPANSVVDFNGFCLQCTVEVARALNAESLVVLAEARVREGDPRALTLISALLHFAAGVWPWR